MRYKFLMLLMLAMSLLMVYEKAIADFVSLGVIFGLGSALVAGLSQQFTIPLLIRNPRYLHGDVRCVRPRSQRGGIPRMYRF